MIRQKELEKHIIELDGVTVTEVLRYKVKGQAKGSVAHSDLSANAVILQSGQSTTHLSLMEKQDRQKKA